MVVGTGSNARYWYEVATVVNRTFATRDTSKPNRGLAVSVSATERETVA
jgi:hypothetical protein